MATSVRQRDTHLRVGLGWTRRGKPQRPLAIAIACTVTPFERTPIVHCGPSSISHRPSTKPISAQTINHRLSVRLIRGYHQRPRVANVMGGLQRCLPCVYPLFPGLNSGDWAHGSYQLFADCGLENDGPGPCPQTLDLMGGGASVAR